MGAFPWEDVRICPVGREDRSVASLVIPSLPLGIVIKSGAPAPKPVRFWAYMWAADEEMAADHWHQRVPSEHAA
jgi:hypothetical protein